MSPSSRSSTAPRVLALGVFIFLHAALVPTAQAKQHQPAFQVCDDKRPSGRHSCHEQKQWGKCTQQWFVDGNYCRKTCGRCREFDPRKSEVSLRGAMNQCRLKSEQAERACVDAILGNDLGVAVRSSPDGDDAELSMGEVFQSDAFFRLMRECNVGCLVEHSDDMLVRSIVGGFVEKHESRSKKLGDILTADALAMMLLNCFKYVRCGMDQFLVIVPKLYEVLLRHSPSQDRHLLGQIYQISGTLEGANETIEYASPYQGHPSASTCLAKSLKEFLSVRKCVGGGRGYSCYNGRG